MTLEEMWVKAKPFYEESYKVKISIRPTDVMIMKLYQDMIKMKQTMSDHERRILIKKQLHDRKD